MGDIRHRRVIALVAALLMLLPLAAGAAASQGLAVDDSYATTEDVDGGFVVPVETGLLANDTGDSSTLCVVDIDTTNLQGTIDLGGARDGSFTYTPPANFNGITTFTYVVATRALTECPGPPADEGEATVTITVTPVNDAPTAVADSFTALRERTLNVAAPGVLGNDSDLDGDTLSAVKTSSPSHGVVTLAADGSFSYTPDAGYVGSDAFSYRASDGTADSAQRLVNLTVVALPATPIPAPTATPTPVPPTASPEPSPSESALPSDSGLASPSPVDTGLFASSSPTAGPDLVPSTTNGGPPIVAIGALVLLAGLLGIAAYYFLRSQRGAGDEESEPETAGAGYGPDGGEDAEP